MPADHVQNPYRPLIVAAILLVLVAIIGYASTVLIPIAVGILLTFILSPAVSLLQARGLRRNTAVLLVIATTLLVLIGMLAALTVQLRALADDVNTHQSSIKSKIKDLIGGKGDGLIGQLTQMFDEVEKANEEANPSKADLKVLTVRIEKERPSAYSIVPIVAGPAWAVLGKIGLTLALTTSMLVMREDLRNRLFLLLGEGNLTSSTKAIDDASKRISRYLITQVVLNAAFGLVFGLGLLVIGVAARVMGWDEAETLPPYARYALVWGVLAAALRFVPYVGTWMAAVFPVMVSLTAAGWIQPFIVVAWCVLLGMIVNSVIEPMLVSRSTGVTPIALVVSMAFWVWLWGPIGLVLATPLAVCLSVLGKHVPSLRFLDVLLGSAAPLEPEIRFYQRLLAHDEAEAAELIDDHLKDHTTEGLLDQFIVPALVRARTDHERGNLSAEELHSLVETVRDLMEVALGEPDQEPNSNAALILGCPAHDDVDRLALELFGRLLDPAKARLKLISADLTTSEVVELVTQEKPSLVLAGLVPPGGGARARYLCKRLRARQPRLPIVVGVWGMGDPGQLGVQLIASGASEVSGSLAGTRTAIAPLIQFASQLMQVAPPPLVPVG